MKKPTTLADAIAKRARHLGYQRGYQAGLKKGQAETIKRIPNSFRSSILKSAKK